MKRNTKSALLLSVVSIILCCTMLLGTTMAWFTDSVTSARNTIVAGNLDVELEYSTNGADWNPVTSETSVFNNDALWEPGHREVVMLRVKNAGTLALKYSLSTHVYNEIGSVNVNNEDFKLSDYLVVEALCYQSDALGYDAMVENFFADRDVWFVMDEYDFDENITTDGQLQPGAENTVFLSITMPTTVGNEANYKTGEEAPKVEFGLTVLATQLASEYDSFDNQYDKDSEYGNSYIAAPETATTVTTFAELKAAIATGGDIAIMNDIAVEETLSVSASTVIYGQGNKLTFAGESSISIFNATNALTIKDLVIDGQNKAYVANGTTAIATTAALTIEGCEIKNFNGTQLVRHSGNSAHAVVIKDTNIHDNNILGDSTSNRTGAGVLLYLDEAATLLDNVKIVNNTVANGNNTWGASNTFSSILYGRNAGHTMTAKNLTLTGNTAGPVYVGRSLAASTIVNFESGLIEHTSTITVFNSMTVGSGMTIKVSKINFSNVNATIKSTLTNNGVIEADIVNGNTSRGEPIYTGTGTHTGTITGLTIQ